MPIWLFQEVDKEADKHGISRSQYITELLRDHSSTPFEPMENAVVCRDENGEINENVEGAA
ncbi:CopG family transcriptional regulator [Haloarcula argentinensis]|uniref:CopG family transcriptional regulator n=1 Tax=Haloarcula argentinensis TaxID=43776 RepID=UPI0016634325|nr:CopG family transcriptional regulator [Haloarcula argentinensis]